jgi:lipopolysaccharide heptosyltransferase II
MIAPPESVLVLRFGSVGDVILTAPAIEALHAAWPKTRILYGVKEGFAHLVAHNPHISEVVPIKEEEGILSYSRRFRELRYGALLDLHASTRSRLLRFILPNSPTAVWRKRDFSETLLVKLALRPYHASMRLADRFHAAVERLVGRTLPRGQLQYFLGPEDQRVADLELDRASIDLGRPLIGISPGANWHTKRWPAERFGHLAVRAIDAGYQVAIVGDRAESQLGSTIVSQAGGAVDLCGKLDLRGLGGFISRCTAFVSNDSGPMHMARALGVPTLAIFGSTDPKMFDFGEHGVLFAGVPCSPCSFFGRSRCPRRHFRCMLQLDAERAWSALQPLLSGTRRASVSA